VALPQFNIPAIKAKIDTSACTSALHTFHLEDFTDNGQAKVRFWTHPSRRDTGREILCVAQVVDRRVVCDSGGHREDRFVIHTPVCLHGREWSIEITLTNRENMLFRMLLGRSASASCVWPETSRYFVMLPKYRGLADPEAPTAASAGV
jgi:hypothetical protein